MLENTENAHCLLLLKVKEGIAYIGVKAYPEVGFSGRAEYGSTMQTGSSSGKCSPAAIEDCLDRVNILLDVWQSDEGGRFFRNVCRYTLAYLDHEDVETEPYIHWLSAHELEALRLQRGYLSNELRTSLSLLHNQ